MARNPSIACHYGNFNNDSSNLTEVVLFDKYVPATQSYNIEGFYNLQAANHDHFQTLTISNPSHYNIQPSVNFNPYDSTFMVTYYDSTTQKLPFLINNVNLANPDGWQFLTTGYNDSGNLAQPYPKVTLDLEQRKGANVWAKEGTGGNGIAMFDSPYSTYTGIFSKGYPSNGIQTYVYPNPCNNEVNIKFVLEHAENIEIEVFSQLGEKLKTVESISYAPGQNIVNIDLSQFSQGTYILTLTSSTYVETKKIVIIR
jgi:hypothetical protein